MIDFMEKKSPAIRNVLISALIVSLVVGYLYWGKFSGNITGFFRIGSVLALSPYLNPAQTFIFNGEIGYDGQQFLSLALDPGLQNPDTLAALDHPSYRYRRILYPLLGYVLGLGNPTLIPYAMVAINAVTILLLVWALGNYFKSYPQFQWHPLYALSIPGIWMVLSLSTADLLSNLFLVTALYGYFQRKPPLTAVALGLGCLTRETMLLIWLGIGMTSLWERRKEMILPLILAVVPAAVWNLYIISRHLPGHSGISANFGFPFLGILDKFASLFHNGLTFNNLFEGFLFGLLMANAASIFWIYRQNPQGNRAVFLCSLLVCTMLAFSKMTILGYYLDYSRVYEDLYFLCLLSLPLNTFFLKRSLFILSGVGSLAFLGLHS
jgi:hypothetical protein